MVNLSIPSGDFFSLFLIWFLPALHPLGCGLVGQFLDDALYAVRNNFPCDLADYCVADLCNDSADDLIDHARRQVHCVAGLMTLVWIGAMDYLIDNAGRQVSCASGRMTVVRGTFDYGWR